MATLVELSGLVNDPTLTAKCSAACMIAAEAIRLENTGTANHANRLKWAKKVLENPSAQGIMMVRAALAANASLTLVQLNLATDASIQTAVNNSVDTLADGS
jgi:hypothetical protein